MSEVNVRLLGCRPVRIFADVIQGHWHAQKLACEIVKEAARRRAGLLPMPYKTVEGVEERTFTGDIEEPFFSTFLISLRRKRDRLKSIGLAPSFPFGVMSEQT